MLKNECFKYKNDHDKNINKKTEEDDKIESKNMIGGTSS